MPTRREWQRRERQRRGEAEVADLAEEPVEISDEAVEPPPLDPDAETNAAASVDPKESYAGRPDQDITRNTGAGAGGATEWGGGNKNHPSGIGGRPRDS